MLKKLVGTVVVAIIGIAIIAGILFLLRERTVTIGEPSSPPPASIARRARDTRVYQGVEPPLRFSYPRDWGDVVVLGSDDSFYALPGDYDNVWTFSNLSKGRSACCDVTLSFRKYDAQHQSYEICSLGDEPPCRTAELFQEKTDIERTSNVLVGGFRGAVHDEYGVPSGTFARVYTFFSPTHKIDIAGTYDSFAIYGGEVADAASGPSIIDVISRDIGKDIRTNPEGVLDEVIRKHPEQSELREFYEDLRALVNSLEVM